MFYYDKLIHGLQIGIFFVVFNKIYVEHSVFEFLRNAVFSKLYYFLRQKLERL